MGDYVELPGVRTWYETEGAGEPLVLLHGGFCTNETWGAQRGDLAARYRVYLPERRGHGRTPDTEGPLTYEDMARDTADFLTSVVGGAAHLVGWSDGGIVALLVAMARPDLVRKAVVIGVNFRPAAESWVDPGMLDRMTPDSEDLVFLRELYEAASPDGPDHWAVVAPRILDMWRTQPTLTGGDLARIGAPTLVLVGDDDMMTLEHTAALYGAIPDARLAVVPGASHLVPLEKSESVNRLVLEHLGTDGTDTMMPVRRAAPQVSEEGGPAASPRAG